MNTHFSAIVARDVTVTVNTDVYLMKNKYSTAYTRVDYKSIQDADWQTICSYDFNYFHYRDNGGKLFSVAKKPAILLGANMEGTENGVTTILTYPIKVLLTTAKTPKILRYVQEIS